MTTEQELPDSTFADKSIAPAEKLEVGATPPSGGASSSPMYRRILLVVAILVCLVLGVYFKSVIHAFKRLIVLIIVIIIMVFLSVLFFSALTLLVGR